MFHMEKFENLIYLSFFKVWDKVSFAIFTMKKEGYFLAGGFLYLREF